MGKLPKIQGILVVSRGSMKQSDISNLTQQIVDSQKAKGYVFASGFEAKHVAAGADVENQTFAMGWIFREFARFEGSGFSRRIKIFPWSLPLVDSGKFYVVYDGLH
jgi:hypothetical protein